MGEEEWMRKSDVDVRVNVEEHAISLSVAERYTFRVCFAERLAGREGVFGAAGFKVVPSSGGMTYGAMSIAKLLLEKRVLAIRRL